MKIKHTVRRPSKAGKAAQSTQQSLCGDDIPWFECENLEGPINPQSDRPFAHADDDESIGRRDITFGKAEAHPHIEYGEQLAMHVHDARNKRGSTGKRGEGRSSQNLNNACGIDDAVQILNIKS
jgi:hypothetical protein